MLCLAKLEHRLGCTCLHKQLQGFAFFEKRLVLLDKNKEKVFDVNVIKLQQRCLLFRGALQEIPRLRLACQAMLEGCSQQFVYESCLALHEAFVNIVRHGKGDKTQIVLMGFTSDEGCTFKLLDQTEGFVYPKKSQLPSPREGGYGLYLIEHLTQKVKYFRKTTPAGWNQLVLHKRFRHEDRNRQPRRSSFDYFEGRAFGCERSSQVS